MAFNLYMNSIIIMDSYKFAEYVDRIFYPSISVIAGIVVLLIYLYNSLYWSNDVAVIMLSGAVYLASVYFGKRFVENEDALYFFSAVIAIFAFTFLSVNIPVSKEFYFAILSIFLVSVVTYFIRYRWKVSAHMSAICSIFVILLLVDRVFWFIILVLPVVAWSRLKLKAHTPAQVIVGTLLGIVAPYFIYLILL